MGVGGLERGWGVLKWWWGSWRPWKMPPERLTATSGLTFRSSSQFIHVPKTSLKACCKQYLPYIPTFKDLTIPVLGTTWIRVLWMESNLGCNTSKTLQRRHNHDNEHDGVSNHQPYDCLLNRLFRRRSKKTSKLCVTGLCVGNSPGTGEFPAQRASNAAYVSIWWRHHETDFENLEKRP